MLSYLHLLFLFLFLSYLAYIFYQLSFLYPKIICIALCIRFTTTHYNIHTGHMSN